MVFRPHLVFKIEKTNLHAPTDVLPIIAYCAAGFGLSQQYDCAMPRIAPPTPTISADAKAGATGNDDAKASVIITLDGLGLADEVYEKYDLATLERRLETRLEETGEGELDGHESGPESTQLFLYGPNARTLFDAIAPVLRAYPLCRNAHVQLDERGSASEFLLDGPALN